MFDTATRNKLYRFVSQARMLLGEEFTRQFQQNLGMDPARGEVRPLDTLTHLNADQFATAQLLRDTLTHYQANHPEDDNKAHLQRLVREQAFTTLNRICALRLAEARGIVRECVSKGTHSEGFRLYQEVAGASLGDTGTAYRHFLFSLFDEFATDLAALFDRFHVAGRLFPRESTLTQLLDLINDPELDAVWSGDETIGWIYQYFNDPDERKAMRAASQAPRNSRELAVRNQFFTPRYVVEFLTDNTLGRIWLEMSQGQTALKDRCTYLVYRPDEVYLDQPLPRQDQPDHIIWCLIHGKEETFPAFTAADPGRLVDLAHSVNGYKRHGADDPWVRLATKHGREQDWGFFTTQALLDWLFLEARGDRMSGDGDIVVETWFVAAANEVRRRALAVRQPEIDQETQLRQVVFLPLRPLKDPRCIRLLDPACGSMHFGLYAFDLLETIYTEAWDLTENHQLELDEDLTPLREAYNNDREAFLRDVPRLILEHNIHGIDIDPRAAQIAGLALWLRAQRAWHDAKIDPHLRPQIQRSNIVCAEPMPGEEDLLRQFTQGLNPPILGQLVETIFEKMALAGEAGYLLRIDEEIREGVDSARDAFLLEQKVGKQGRLFAEPEQGEFDFRGLGKRTVFWERAEERILAALKTYAEEAGRDSRRRLFAQDAARGFSFIDLSRKRFDAMVMNPPFGDFSIPFRDQAKIEYPNSYSDILAAFVDRGGQLLQAGGRLGAITSRTCFFLSSFTKWRQEVVLGQLNPELLVDLGHGVMDAAMVEAAAYVLAKPISTPAV